MSDQAANFTGNIPEHYDRGCGPILFADFADDGVPSSELNALINDATPAFTAE